MPCQSRYNAALQETETSEDGVKMYTWRAVRRQNLKMLRKHTRDIVFFMALFELVVRHNVIDVVYGGKHDTQAPGPEAYGIAYNVAYIIGWLWMCFFAIVYTSLFSWWVPKLYLLSPSNESGSGEDETSILHNLASILQKFNMVLMPACVGLGLMYHIYYTACTFIYVDAKPVDPKTKYTRSLNRKQAWSVRLLLLGGILTTMGLGKGIFMILEDTDLARVKPLEYLIIVLPVQINLGILLGSGVQFKAEQRAARKLAMRLTMDKEAGAVDEKRRLIAAV